MHNFKKSLAAIAVTASLGLSFNVSASAATALAGTVNVSNAAEYTVTAKDPKTGSTRTVSVNADGSFRFAKMDAGSYLVTVNKNGNKVAEDTVRVSLGSTASATFDIADNGGDMESIEVKGARISGIDLSTTDSGLVIGESELDVMPVARNLTAVALLAPGTVQGDSGFGDFASFAGSSVSENACYINGLEVTNTRNGLGCGSVPFEFYKEFQVKTGGYSAYYGRATGGTINAVTKSGTNDWEFAATATWQPDSLQEEGRESRGSGGTGNVFSDARNNSYSSFDYTVSAAGPIIEDTLFIYALINPRDVDNNFSWTEGRAAYSGINSFYERSGSGSDNLFWGAKIDWDISDNHRLSYFAYSDRNDTVESRFKYDPETQIIDRTPTGFLGDFLRKRGGEAQSLSYTGFITDDLNVSAMWGTIDSEYETNNLGADDNCPSVIDPAGVINRCGSGLNKSAANNDSNTQYRIDVEYTIGDHNIKFGADVQERESVNITSRIGGHAYTYSVLENNSSIGTLYTNTTGASQNIVEDRIFEGGGGFKSNLTAYYIEDQWQVTDNLMLSLGLRKDKFDGSGTTNVELFNFNTSIAPRLGFTWDIAGNGESKFYGTYGTYYLPVANNTIFRAAAGVSDSTTYYTYTGHDSTNGTPTGLSPVNGTVGNSQNVNSIPVTPSKDIFQTQEADPFSRDEWIIGYETSLNDDLTVGVKGIYREVTTALDDYCGAYAYPYCLMVNPGKSATAYKDGVYYYGAGDPRNNLDENDPDEDYSAFDLADGVADPGSLTTTSAATIGLPEANNEYTALQLSANYRNESFRLNFLYTWSRSVGNFEGAVKSDVNQSDAGVTQDFDFPALMDGAQGYQANDRRHVFKIFGSYNITEDFSLGFNTSLSSGKPMSAFGAGYPDHNPDIFGSYGDTFYHFTGNCSIELEEGASCPQASKIYTFHPRGSVGRTPWLFNVDLGGAYNFNVSGVDMRATFDVFNIFNIQEVNKINEHYEGRRSEGTVNQYYGAAYSFTNPRSVRLGIEARF